MANEALEDVRKDVENRLNEMKETADLESGYSIHQKHDKDFLLENESHKPEQ